MIEDKDIAPLDEVVEYIRKSEWQFKMLGPDHSIRMSARMVYSIFHYLKAVEKVLREQQNRTDPVPASEPGSLRADTVDRGIP